MSIYSGFATRFQQQAYDQCIDSLLYVLQKRIIKFYQNEQVDEQKFIGLVMRIHQQMRTMQKNKYLDPKSSQAVTDLVKFIQTYQENMPNNINRESQPQKTVELLPTIQPRASVTVPITIPEVIQEKKKGSSLWVQKPVPVVVENISKVSVDQDVQTMGTINFHKRQITVDKTEIQKQQFRKTSVNNAGIKGLKPKATVKFNLKDYKIPQNETIDIKRPKKRSMSNYISQFQNTRRQLPLNSNISQHQSSITRKNKVKSNSKKIINQDENQLKQAHNEVSDIIRQYITKVKKNYLRGHSYRESRQSEIKHDF